MKRSILCFMIIGAILIATAASINIIDLRKERDALRTQVATYQQESKAETITSVLLSIPSLRDFSVEQKTLMNGKEQWYCVVVLKNLIVSGCGDTCALAIIDTYRKVGEKRKMLCENLKGWKELP